MVKGPLLAIVGPTASGKTALSLQLAQQYDGEIICADSRTIYKGMDIGTAKPSVEEQALVRHHLLDAVAPNEPFTVVDFCNLATSAVADIQRRGRLPILVGGTGLYVDALLYNYQFRPVDQKVRADLEQLSLMELQRRIENQGIDLNESDRRNPRRLIRALESSGQLSEKAQHLPEQIAIIGLKPDPKDLESRIAERTNNWLSQGLTSEAAQLFERYGTVEPLNTTPYREIKELLDGHIQQTEAEELINLHLRQLAKRQLTWFERNKDVMRVSSDEAKAAAESFLAKAL